MNFERRERFKTSRDRLREYGVILGLASAPIFVTNLDNLAQALSYYISSRSLLFGMGVLAVTGVINRYAKYRETNTSSKSELRELTICDSTRPDIGKPGEKMGLYMISELEKNRSD